MKLQRTIGIFLLFYSFYTFGIAPQETYEQEDIHGVMQQLLDQHLGKNKINEVVIRDSFKNYIDQFDPDRIYLLDREVAPFLNINPRQMERIVRQYQNNDFTVYKELNAVIQQSIDRAREIRNQNLQDQAYLLKETRYQQPKKGQPFAKSIKELKGRIKNNMIGYINMQKKRFGEAYVMKHPAQILLRYIDGTKNIEDQYLFQDRSGNPLPKQEREDLFVLYVLKSLAKSLDAHTQVLSPSEAYDLRIRLEKGFPGVAIVLQQKPKGTYITSILPEGPADKSKFVRVNDKIVSIDGNTVDHRPLKEVIEMLRGEKGTSVELVLQRKVKEGHRYVDKDFPIELTRKMIAIDEGRVTTKVEPLGNGIIGTLSLKSFYRGPNGISSTNDMMQSINKLNSKGNLRGLIIDLRDNTGGYLTEAVKVAGLFITNGVIVTAKYSDGKERIFRDVDNHVAFDGPIVILTSKATASAAEIVAQALQDYGVAVVVGDESTYGKGTIQNQTVTRDKAASFFKVTVGKYYTVSGKTPDQVGVKADIILPSQLVHNNFGNEILEYISESGDTIPQSYQDSLKDVPQDSHSWYLRYYVPTLQHREDTWKDMIPTLRQNSAKRLEKNKDYKLFLKHSGHPVAYEEDDEEEDEIETVQNYGVNDLQMAEAVNIVKDMIIIHQHVEPQAETTASN